MGKRKFVTIPLLTVALVAVIAVSVIILTQVIVPEPVSTETWLEDQWSSGAIYEANQAASAGNVDEALRIIDDALDQERGHIERELLLNVEKSAIAANGDRMDLSIETTLDIIEINRSRGDKENLENNYACPTAAVFVLG